MLSNDSGRGGAALFAGERKGRARGAGLAAFWRAYAAVYDVIWDSPLTARINDELVNACVNAQGEARRTAEGRPLGAVVDIGCGTGLLAQRFKALGWEVTGVDASPAMLRRALRCGRVSTARRAEADSTGLGSACAECVLVSNVLHLVDSPDAVLSEAARLVRPGGALLAAWPANDLALADLYCADVRVGRGAAAAARANALRAVIGIPGVLAGARRLSGAAVRRSVGAWALARGAVVLAQGTSYATTEYALLTKVTCG